jgi:nicotinamide mononucleotide adenylyltransferase
MSIKTHLTYDGVIHGRFQILHKDHIKYLLTGKNYCNHLIIGITNPDPSLTKKEQADPHRSKPIRNPLTYFERYVVIKEALLYEGLTLEEFSIVPFPINYPDLIKNYVPIDAIFFLTIYDKWGKQKKKYLESLGLKTHVLWKVPKDKKGISATTIRNKMIKDEKWENLVPLTTKRFMYQWNIPERLRKLASKAED